MSVLIVNAKVVRVDAPAPSASDGTESWTPGSAIAVDATMDDPSGSQRLTLGATIREATAVIYVLWSEMPGAGSINEGWRVVARLVVDGVEQAGVVYRVLKRGFRSFDELSHLELFVKEVGES